MQTRRAAEFVEKKTQMSKGTMKQSKGSGLQVGVEPHPTKQSLPVEATEELPRKQIRPPILRSCNREKKTVVAQTRRSSRLQNVLMHVQDKEVDRLLNEITVSITEDEFEDVDNEQGMFPDSTSSPMTLEEKVDSIAQQLEVHEKLFEELKSQSSLPIHTSSAGSIRYKNLYFKSQKKTEALMDVNQKLATNLEHALGKIEGYEAAAGAFSSAMEKLKDVIMASTMSAKNFSNNALHDALASVDSGAEAKKYAAKRKRKTTRRT